MSNDDYVLHNDVTFFFFPTSGFIFAYQQILTIMKIAFITTERDDDFCIGKCINLLEQICIPTSTCIQTYTCIHLNIYMCM